MSGQTIIAKLLQALNSGESDGAGHFERDGGGRGFGAGKRVWAKLLYLA